MDSTTTSNVTDDQELARVLENMNQQATAGVPDIPQSDDPAVAATPSDGLAFEETPAPAATTEPEAQPEVGYVPAEETTPAPDVPVTVPAVTPSASPELDSIKKTALEELRPLVDKLELPADEKFDTLLLIIRSTDDKSLVGAAHDAARAIEDETKRAQALLDVIKEIDYFSGHGANPA